MESEWKVHLIDSLKTNLQEKNKTERVSSFKLSISSIQHDGKPDVRILPFAGFIQFKSHENPQLNNQNQDNPKHQKIPYLTLEDAFFPAKDKLLNLISPTTNGENYTPIGKPFCNTNSYKIDWEVLRKKVWEQMPDEEKRIYISYKSYPIDHDFYHYFHSHGYKEEKGERNHHLDYQYNFKYSTSISNGSEENGKRRSSVSKKKDSHIIIHRKSSIKRKFRPTPTPSQAKTRNEKEFIENHQNLTQKAKDNNPETEKEISIKKENKENNPDDNEYHEIEYGKDFHQYSSTSKHSMYIERTNITTYDYENKIVDQQTEVNIQHQNSQVKTITKDEPIGIKSKLNLSHDDLSYTSTSTRSLSPTKEVHNMVKENENSLNLIHKFFVNPTQDDSEEEPYIEIEPYLEDLYFIHSNDIDEEDENDRKNQDHYQIQDHSNEQDLDKKPSLSPSSSSTSSSSSSSSYSSPPSMTTSLSNHEENKKKSLSPKSLSKKELEKAYSNFCLLIIDIETIDYLEMSYFPPKRTTFYKIECPYFSTDTNEMTNEKKKEYFASYKSFNDNQNINDDDIKNNKLNTSIKNSKNNNIINNNYSNNNHELFGNDINTINQNFNRDIKEKKEMKNEKNEKYYDNFNSIYPAKTTQKELLGYEPFTKKEIQNTSYIFDNNEPMTKISQNQTVYKKVYWIKKKILNTNNNILIS
ncbi:hypothetical protein H8356DRAFT_1380675 [Neocallimastix lanati (nom. inval.)]|uniref:Pyridoxamine 5'-phosphate oxidase Alr4036 family FMN-binding domain-containing protein n=1 Tax=Neocallimastix californiae TaxID=1754190 RepID=A0A1Y2FCK8_9FUNG|nr:hypothetical protein H8356DRAFT_1380675 [Neocallimastix sp. JGI-2020a]ORY81658.1 hypothetical protein LY90DRAFT_500045 [Neocallimastix californiae]|eukprot:ORY81658.1 hypothetical protein LY90DRAFT_500045 [Neocallimastix californiae]